MKIIIIGAGQVGSTLAENLAGEANDITVIDQDIRLLSDLQDRLDIRTITGFGSHPEVLRRAGANEADMLIAVTGIDEINIVACQIADTLFHTPTKIARVRAPQYIDDAEMRDQLFTPESIPVDMLISPEKLVTLHIKRLIQYPGALQVLDFADGRVRLVGVRAYYGGPLVGHELRTIRDHMPKVDTRVAAIYRRGQAIIPEGDTVIEADDEVFFIAARKDIRKVMSELRQVGQRARRIMIAGGGNIGLRLAQQLEKQNNVKIIERGANRARDLADILDRTVVLLGDAADEDLLTEENIEHIDVFCAVTDDDEANILSSMLAKRLGAKRVMALINRPAYVDLVLQGSIIDIAISPQQTTIGALLSHVRAGDVVVAHSLRRGAAEAIEAIAHSSIGSKVVGQKIEDIPLPPDTTIAAIVRGEEVIMAHHDVVVEAEDHLILFLIDKNRLADVEKLFQILPNS